VIAVLTALRIAVPIVIAVPTALRIAVPIVIAVPIAMPIAVPIAMPILALAVALSWKFGLLMGLTLGLTLRTPKLQGGAMKIGCDRMQRALLANRPDRSSDLLGAAFVYRIQRSRCAVKRVLLRPRAPSRLRFTSQFPGRLQRFPTSSRRVPSKFPASVR